MIKEIIIGLLIGSIIGITPGMHPNTIAPLLRTSTAVLIISLLITTNYFEFIKATYLSTPSSGDELTIKYSQELIANGRGVEAIKLLSIGALGTTIIASIIAPIITVIIPPINKAIINYIPIILSALIIHTILKDDISKATIITIMSGILGVITLRSQAINQPLLPLLSGLFGLSNALINNNEFPTQLKKIVIEINNKTKIKGIIKALLSSSIITITPAIGPSQSAMISNELVKTRNKKEKLITLGGVNTGDVLFSLTAYYSIGKARSGVIELINKPLFNEYLLLIITAIITSILCYLIINKLSYKISSLLNKVNFNKINKIIIALIIIINMIISGWKGLIILITATLIGLLSNDYKVNQNLLMSSIMIPTIIYYT